MPETKISDVAVPLPWEDAEQHVERAKLKAARQFLALWRKHKDRQDSALKWGEEVEYMLVDLSEGRARLALCADELLRRLGSETGGSDPVCGAGWRTEYGNHMVEGVTYPPFEWPLDEVLKIEPALAWRRRELERVLKEVQPSAHIVTLSAFPLLGTPDCTVPAAEPSPEGEVSQSVLCPDEVTSPHPRYQTFTANYRKRKGCKVGAFVPREGIAPEQRLSPAQLARLPCELAASGGHRQRDPVPGHIYMDSQAFGAGQCCTQVTFLTPTLADARYLTDQFLVLAPLLLALTAATPFLRGSVADTDTRWPTFKQTWDDRKESELESLCNSRTSANDLFIDGALAEDPEANSTLNDVEVPVHEPTLRLLAEQGMDAGLARHAAHVLARDPLMIFEDRLDIDDETEADHWEQVQGTNWGTVRFKPPPCKGDIGWRVEFRTPEVQPTDFENAAIVGVIRVLAEVILEERWDVLMPISMCDANDEASGLRNAAVEGIFWFPEELVTSGGDRKLRKYKQLRLVEILSGPCGVLTECRRWVQANEGRCSPEARAKLFEYFSLFEKRASGELPTPATALRARLACHGSYQGDGVVPEAFVHELCSAAAKGDAALRAELLQGAPAGPTPSGAACDREPAPVPAA